MRSAIWVLNIFATIWCAAAILISGWPTGFLVVPLCVAVACAAFAGHHAPRPRDRGQQAAAWKAVSLWGGIELAAIVVVAALLVRFGAHAAVMPAVAIIVGLHFLPLASSIGVPLYRATAAGLIVAGAIALVLPAPMRPAAVGISAAAILWSSCAAILVRGRRAEP